MDWEAARNRELAHWFTVRAAIGNISPVTLLTEISASDTHCEKAHEEVPGRTGDCLHCVFYQQLGGCREVSGRMSERVVAGDWDGLRALLDQLIRHLCGLENPLAASAAVHATAAGG